MTIAALIQGGTALFNTFKGSRDASKTNKQMGQIQQYGQQAYNPFIQQGQQANQQLSPQYQQMAQNPTGQYNDIMSQYQPSQGYQYQKDKLNQYAHNTAASGGYAGTGGDVQDRSELFNGLMGKDMQQFLENIFKIQGSGMQGLEGQQQRGYESAGNLADYMGAAQGQKGLFNMISQNNNQANRSDASSILAGLIGGKGGGEGGLGDIFGSIFGGGKQATPYTSLNSLDFTRPQSQKAAASGLTFG